MGQILSRWRVPFASLLALLLIAAAYFIARGIQSPSLAQASPEAALLQAIASRDSDQDGLPDWEEALYGTSPSNPDTQKLGMTDGEAVRKGLIVPKAIADLPATGTSVAPDASVDPALGPVPPEGTLTAAFSRQFIAAYLAAKEAKGSGDLTQDDIHAIANQILISLATSVKPAPDFKMVSDLKIAGSGRDALREFAVSVEAVLQTNTLNATMTELTYLDRVLQQGDAQAISELTELARSYRAAALGIAALPVPRELAAASAGFINVFMRTSQIATDFTKVESDPLTAMLALYQYPRKNAALVTALAEIGKVYNSANVTFAPGTPGSVFAALAGTVFMYAPAADTQP